jgi:ABC-2 type transport system permease protein
MLLRLHRTGFVAVAAISAVSGGAQVLAFASIAGSTPEEHRAFGRQMELLGHQLSYLLPVPLRVDTLPGYVQWRGLGFLPVVFAFWAVLASSGGTRGDEERGLVESWLAAGLGRARLLLARCAAFALAALAAAGVGAAFTELASAAIGSPLPADRLLEVMLLDAVVGAWCYAFTALVGQLLAPARTAAGVAGAILLFLNLLNGLGREGGWLAPYRPLSPFYYVDRTTALAPGGSFDLPAAALLAVTAALLAVLAAAAFGARDLDAPLLRRRASPRPPIPLPDPNPLLRLPVLAPLYEQRFGLLAWAAGLLVLGAYLASIVKAVVRLVTGDAAGFAGYLALLQGHGQLERAVVGAAVFPVLQLLLAVYAVTTVGRWAAEDSEGRLEMELAAPVHRWRVVLERGATLLAAVALLALAGVVGTGIVGAAQGLALPAGGLFRAGALLLPFALGFGALGAALAGRFPRAAVALLSAFAVVSYLLQQFAPLFRWPGWVGNLSLFGLYGDPLNQGVRWGGLGALLAVVAVGFGAAVLALERRDVGA